MSDTAELPEKTVIGISFGNTNSSIAFTGPVSLPQHFEQFQEHYLTKLKLQDGKAEIIANEEGGTIYSNNI